mmetsp:Transcript_48424/g.111216  ORF Transcript_48424/g.111216 Transcript_48424/m.111216 type:complete len:564 (+) Transcript_48424:3-1694(+)
MSRLSAFVLLASLPAATTSANPAVQAGRRLFGSSSSSRSRSSSGPSYHYPSSSTSSHPSTAAGTKYTYPSSSSSSSASKPLPHTPPTATATASSTASSHGYPPPYSATPTAATPTAASGQLATAYGQPAAAYGQPAAAYSQPYQGATYGQPGYHAPMGGGMGGGSSISPTTALAAGAVAGGVVGYVAGNAGNHNNGGYNHGGSYGSGYNNNNGGGYNNDGYNNGGGGYTNDGGVNNNIGFNAGGFHNNNGYNNHSNHHNSFPIFGLLLLLGCFCGFGYFAYKMMQGSSLYGKPVLPQYSGASATHNAAGPPPPSYGAGPSQPPPSYLPQAVATAYPDVSAKLATATGLSEPTATALLAMRQRTLRGIFIVADDSVATDRPITLAAPGYPPTVWADISAQAFELGSLILALGKPTLQAGLEPQPALWVKLLNAQPHPVDETVDLTDAFADQVPEGPADYHAALEPLLTDDAAGSSERLLIVLLGGLPTKPLRALLDSKASWVHLIFVLTGDCDVTQATTLEKSLRGVPNVTVAGSYIIASEDARARGASLSLAEHFAAALLHGI